MSQYTCPCCGHRALDSFHDWDVCPVCRWEDDLLGDIDAISPANHIWLSQAQANFMLYGASQERSKKHARPALEDEPIDALWKPFPKALELVTQAKEKG